MFKRFIDNLFVHLRGLVTAGKTMNEIKMLSAKLLIDRIADGGLRIDIQGAEFKVFSQFGEDGIIQYLIRQAKVTRDERTAIEFGSDFYGEANTRLLVLNDNWRALLIDGKQSSIRSIKRQPFYWSHDITAVRAFIDAENINALICDAGFSGAVGLLSIDIDGNDYWVWERITVVDPIIVVAEYNPVFGASRAVTIPYDPKFHFSGAHWSGLYYGCSLKALELLGTRKGYALVGCNSNGNNCFFVKRDRLRGQPILSSEDAYVEARYREGRDRSGALTYATGLEQLKDFADLPLVNVETGTTIKVQDLIG